MASSLFNAGFFLLTFSVVLILIRGKVFLGLSLVLTIFIVFFITRGITDTFLYLASQEDNAKKKLLEQVANVISTLFSRVKWFMLYYFVIQAQEVRIRI